MLQVYTYIQREPHLSWSKTLIIPFPVFQPLRKSPKSETLVEKRPSRYYITAVISVWGVLIIISFKWEKGKKRRRSERNILHWWLWPQHHIQSLNSFMWGIRLPTLQELLQMVNINFGSKLNGDLKLPFPPGKKKQRATKSIKKNNINK